MKRLLAGASVALLALIVAAALWLAGLPRVAPPAAADIVATPERVKRGDYLFNAVLGCPVCHSERNFAVFGAPPQPPFGAGRVCAEPGKKLPGVAEAGGLPGTICFPNITPHATGIGDWSDGEILRAVREGIDRDGNALFPIMPAFIYRALSDEDTYSVLSYLRTLEPVDFEHPETRINFPVNWIIRLLPAPLEGPVTQPDTTDPVAYGRYLATVARCAFCHSPRDRRTRQAIPGQEFAGGVPFQGRDALMYSTNLTTHPSGLGAMTRAEFIALFRRAAGPAGAELNLMPWTYYSSMTDADLGAIYAYLQSLPPLPLPAPEAQ